MKAILFDLDGTLINTNDLIVETINKVAQSYLGRGVTEKELHMVYGKVLIEQMRILADDKHEEMVDEFRRIYRENMDEQTTLFEGIKEVLDKLHEMGIPMGVVTNKGRNGVVHALLKFDLEKYFKVIVTADDVDDGKPHPEGIIKASGELGIDIDDIVYVGDTYNDMKSAEAAGVMSAFVEWSLIGIEDLGDVVPDVELTEPKSVLSLV